MRLMFMLVAAVCLLGGCRYSDDVAIEGQRFFVYGEMRPHTRSEIESIIAERGGEVVGDLDETTAVVIQGSAPPSVDPLDREESDGAAMTQWALDSTASQHYEHLTARAKRLGVEVKSPTVFLSQATREDVNWKKVFTFGIAD